jgi:hypothetical protein
VNLARGKWAAVGQQGIRTAADSIRSASVTVLDRKTAAGMGFRGLVLRVARTDSVTASSPLQVSVPDSLLAGSYGASYLSRIRWVQVPDCAGRKGCDLRSEHPVQERTTSPVLSR